MTTTTKYQQLKELDRDQLKVAAKTLVETSLVLNPDADAHQRGTLVSTALITIIYGDTCRPHQMIPVIAAVSETLDERAAQ